MPADAKSGDTGPSEDVKRRFKEALDRKNSHGGADVSDHSEHGKVSEAHGPARKQQMFRRKSGG